jgi:hypothetical protein
MHLYHCVFDFVFAPAEIAFPVLPSCPTFLHDFVESVIAIFSCVGIKYSDLIYGTEIKPCTGGQFFLDKFSLTTTELVVFVRVYTTKTWQFFLDNERALFQSCSHATSLPKPYTSCMVRVWFWQTNKKTTESLSFSTLYTANARQRKILWYQAIKSKWPCCFKTEIYIIILSTQERKYETQTFNKNFAKKVRTCRLPFPETWSLNSLTFRKHASNKICQAILVKKTCCPHTHEKVNLSRKRFKENVLVCTMLYGRQTVTPTTLYFQEMTLTQSEILRYETVQMGNRYKLYMFSISSWSYSHRI